MSRTSPSVSPFAKGANAAVLSAFAAKHVARWQPGSAGSSHNEVFAPSDEASGVALALALARDGMRPETPGALAECDDQRMVLWVQDRSALKKTGRPCLHGLPAEFRHRLIHVTTETAQDALFAIEEGLRCRELAFVLGEIADNPKALDFTASRRLSLVAEKHGVPLWLVRIDAQPDLSSARMRWRSRSSISPPAYWDDTAPGRASWRAELFRARSFPPGEWILHDDDGQLVAARPSTGQDRASTPHNGDMARPTVGRSLAAL